MSALAIYVAGPRLIGAELVGDDLQPHNIAAGDPSCITLEPNGPPPPGAPTCIECRRPARLSINGEALCEPCLVELRTALNAARTLAEDLDAEVHALRREGP